jgi:hypothetical protein
MISSLATLILNLWERRRKEKKTLTYYFEKRNPIKKVLRKGMGVPKLELGPSS